MSLREQLGGWRPSLWAGWSPNGLGQQKPNHYLDMAKVAWDNRAHPKYALDVLPKGVCDGCALGVAGLHDWTIDGVHLCTTRLELLELNTADAVRSGAARRRRRCSRGRPAASCGGSAGSPTPCAAAGVTRGFTRIDWDEALGGGGRCASPRPTPDRVALYLTAAGSPTRPTTSPARRRGPWASRRSTRPRVLPRTLDARAQAVDRRGRHHLLAAGRDRERPDRAVGREPGQQPAGVHEVPLPGQAARGEGRGRQPVPRAGTRALLGAVATWSRRCSAPRSATCTCRCDPAATSRSPTRVLQAARRAGRGRSGLHRRAHRGLGRRWPPTSTTSRLDDLLAARGLTLAPTRRVRRPLRARPRRRSWCGRWASPSTAARSTACAPSSTSRWPAATSGGTAPGSCRSAGTPACRAAPRWARTPRLSREAPPSTPRNAAALAGAVGLPGAEPRRAHRPRDGRGGRAGRARRAVVVAAATSSTCCPTRRASRPRSNGCRCGSTRTSCSPARCSSTRRRRDPAARSPPATSRRAAAPRPPPSAASPSRPRSRARWARPAASGGCSPSCARRGCGPDLAGRVPVARQPGLCAPRSPRSCRPTPASSTLARTGDAGAVGWAHLCAGGAFPTPTAAAASARWRPPPRALPAGTFTRRDAAGQAVQLDGLRRRSTRSPAPAATRCTSTTPTPTQLGIGEGDAGRAALDGRRAAPAT